MAEVDYTTEAGKVGSPIALTFRPVKDVITDKILYLDTYMMCNDTELGLMAPGMYFFAAENSERIEAINFIAIDLVSEAMDLAKIDYDLEPKFSLLLSSRFLEDDAKFAELYAKLDAMELPAGRMILTFSAVTVLRVGRGANTYLRMLRDKGFRIALTDYTVDTAEFSLLCDYHFDYLRIDADYVEDSSSYARKDAAMQMLRLFAQKENVTLVANGVDHPDKIEGLKAVGIYAMSGAAIARGCANLGALYGVDKIEREDDFEDELEGTEANRYTKTKDAKYKVAVGEEYDDGYQAETEYDEFPGYERKREYEDSEVDEDSLNSESVRYSKSFTARLIQADPTVQMYYTAIKNTIHSYRGMISRVGWSYDTILKDKKKLIKIGIRGKDTMVVYFALPPMEYKNQGLDFEDMSGDAKFAKTPVRVKVKGEDSLRTAMKLAILLMERRGFMFGAMAEDDYRMPYESTDELIKRGLIKELRKETYNSESEDGDYTYTTRANRASDNRRRKEADDDYTEFVVCYMKKGGRR